MDLFGSIALIALESFIMGGMGYVAYFACKKYPEDEAYRAEKKARKKEKKRLKMLALANAAAANPQPQS